MALSDVTLRHGVNPYAVIQGTFTLLSAQVIGEVIRGATMAAEPKTEQKALNLKIQGALLVIIVILIIFYFMYKNQLLAGVTYKGLNLPPGPVVPPMPTVKKMLASPLPLATPSSLGVIG